MLTQTTADTDRYLDTNADRDNVDMDQCCYGPNERLSPKMTQLTANTDQC